MANDAPTPQPGDSATEDGATYQGFPPKPAVGAANSPSGSQRPNADLSDIEPDATILSKSPLLAPDAAFAGLQPRELGLSLVGHQIGDMQLEELIGAGGMGAVLRGHDKALQRTVAVKILSTHHVSDEESAKRFQIEARSAARLDHPGIARVYQVGEDRGLRYIIFEYIEGSNVRDLVAQNGPFSIADTLGYSVQVADALTHAWQRNVVHRDIKPSNILITSQKQAKLVDMGLARLHESEPAEQDLTATGMTIGTFDYIAPEQARDPREADTRCDIYSLGCTLFFMLTGRPPFPGGTPLQKLLSHQGDQPPELTGLRGDIPPALAAIVSRMLAKNPDQRYQNPADLTLALLQLSDQLGITRPGVTVSASLLSSPPAPLLWRRHLPWALPTGLLLAGVAALSLFWHPSDRSTDLSADPLRATPAAEGPEFPSESDTELSSS